MRKIKIVVFPEEKGVSPYQELLYDELVKMVNVKVKYFKTKFLGKHILGIFNLPILPKVIWYRLIKKYNTFHIHWTFPLKFPINNLVLRFISFLYILLFLVLIKTLRYKIVWTVHEILPHGIETSNDLFIRKFLSRISDAKIAHSKTTIDEMTKFGLNIENTFVIPLGNFIGGYQNNTTKNKSRKYLNINKEDFVFLFFGGIEKRKGIENLLQSFDKLKNKNIKLIVAGKLPNDPDRSLRIILNNYRKKLNGYLKVNPNFIKEEEVQYYFNCADVVVAPFTRIITSGSVILALSFGKPIICPRMGNLKDLPENIGFYYNPRNDDGLLECMKQAINKKCELEQIGKNAYKYVQKSLGWYDIAVKTYEVYKEIL